MSTPLVTTKSLWNHERKCLVFEVKHDVNSFPWWSCFVLKHDSWYYISKHHVAMNHSAFYVIYIFKFNAKGLRWFQQRFDVGFNHGLPWCVKYIARGTLGTTKADGEAGGFCGDRRPEGQVFHTSRQAMIKTYYSTSIRIKYGTKL